MNESKFEDETSEDLPRVVSVLGSADGVSAESLKSKILPSTPSSFASVISTWIFLKRVFIFIAMF